MGMVLPKIKLTRDRKRSPKKISKNITSLSRSIMNILQKSARCKTSVFNFTISVSIICCLIMVMLLILIYQKQASIIDISEIETKQTKSISVNDHAESLELQAEIMREKIWNRLQELQQPSDCSKVQSLVCTVSKNCDFGCYINAVLQCLALGHKENRTVVLKNEQIFNGDLWSNYMIPLSTCQSYYDQCDRQVLDDQVTEFVTSQNVVQPHMDLIPEYTKEFLNEENMVYPTGWFLGIMNGYIFREFQPNVEQFIQRRIKDLLGEDKNEGDVHFNISCHIQRTDGVSPGEIVKFKTREYVNEIDHMIIMKSKKEIIMQVMDVNMELMYI